MTFVTSVVQVMFQQQFVETEESTQVQFSVVFTPLPTEIPITFMIETFDLSTLDAEGLFVMPISICVAIIHYTYSWY